MEYPSKDWAETCEKLDGIKTSKKEVFSDVLSWLVQMHHMILLNDIYDTGVKGKLSGLEVRKLDQAVSKATHLCEYPEDEL